ncbi:MAG: hypothetical protein G01um101431_34 [Parcubacteria group bacterium Gr01-1014_31]|nr:MAG: hypothetical protein G01um101431_34 [Parcubacteria group bacterium Gr01-1014_31]
MIAYIVKGRCSYCGKPAPPPVKGKEHRCRNCQSIFVASDMVLDKKDRVVTRPPRQPRQ